MISVGVVVIVRLRSVQWSLLVSNLLGVAVLGSVGLGRVGNILIRRWRKDGGAEPRPDLAIERGEMDGGLEGKMRISAERRSNIDDIEMNICEHI